MNYRHANMKNFEFTTENDFDDDTNSRTEPSRRPSQNIESGDQYNGSDESSNDSEEEPFSVRTTDNRM